MSDLEAGSPPGLDGGGQQPTPPQVGGQDTDYLLLSDVHLGSDLVQHLRPWAHDQWLHQQAKIDTPLIELLEHYRTRPSARRIKLVLAGDFLDLVGVAIGGTEVALNTPLNREERVHGLGSAADHVVRKMEAIERRHRPVFQALARFVDDGHTIALVRGNHDIELHWRAARLAFVRAVAQHVPAARRREASARIGIYPWFFSVPGLLYVEHGHEFDAMCSYGDPLVSTCRRDSRRIRATAFSVLLRQVARPTPGVNSASHSYVGMGTYMRLLHGLGMRGTANIAVRYGRASLRLLREGLPALRANRLRAHRSMAAHTRFKHSSGVSADRLSSLRALYTRPAVESPSNVLRILYLDRIGAAVGAACLVTAAATAGGALAATYGACAAGLGAYATIGSGKNQAPHESLGMGARRIAQLFDARWVVMGHTHKPTSQALAGTTTYVNLGSWGQDDPPDEHALGHEPSQTFLLLEQVCGEYQASFLRWMNGGEPEPVRAIVDASEPSKPPAEHAPIAVALPGLSVHRKLVRAMGAMFRPSKTPLTA